MTRTSTFALATLTLIAAASLASKNAFPGGGIYCASKWGLLGLTQCMAEDLRPHGIRVSAICPDSGIGFAERKAPDPWGTDPGIGD